MTNGRVSDLSDTPISISTLSVEDLSAGPPLNLRDLENLTPGITQSPGTSAPTSQVTIRGVDGSGGGDPLVLIDGQRAPGGVGALSAGDINSIEVLRGAAAASLYGAQASNGVVVVTTRSGRGTGSATGTEGSYAAPGVDSTAWLYGQFAGGFSGSVDFNALCDFGSGQVLPGWALSPWLDGYGSGSRFGDNFLVPFDPPPPRSVETRKAGAGEKDAAGKPPSKPEERTELQKWDRGVPPWSLVERSPQVAHLLDKLKPLYERRMKTRADMSYYGDWTLSDWQLRENKADYDAAKQAWQETRAPILTILAAYIDPEIAASVQNADQAVEQTSAATSTPPATASQAYGPGRQWDWRMPADFTVDYYLTTKRELEGGGVDRFPATGAALTPVFPYTQYFPLPRQGGLPDTELNSGLGSARGFADDTGRVRFPLTIPYGQVVEPPLRFDAARYRMGYNLKDKWAGFSLDVNRFDSATVKLEGQAKHPVRSMRQLSQETYDRINDDWKPYLSGSWSMDDDLYLTYTWPHGQKPGNSSVDSLPGIVWSENNSCATEAFPVLYSAADTLDRKQVHDHWAIRRIGFTPDRSSAWRQIAPDAQSVVVAVIDTGLDYHHYDLDWKNIWRNPGEIPDNGIDDDGNGYVDDIIGWDFLEFRNTPWDYDGHGTFVSGLIAASAGNRAGIDGINPNARIMVLKALNNFGHTRAAWLSQAIVYAVDNGARIINLSAAGPGLPKAIQDALDYADRNGVLVVVAAGNSAQDVGDTAPAGLRHVVTVAATGLEDERAEFSNWGDGVDIAAPGVHVMSLRARETDFRLTSAEVPYQRGMAIAGQDRRYYRADGTSFAAPLVSGVASLIWSNDPSLTHLQVRRMLEQSARDIDSPGRDRFTGYGLLDARAALAADPEYFVLAQIDAVSVGSVQGQPVAQVVGTADANAFKQAWVEIGSGENPDRWKRIGEPLAAAVRDEVVGNIPASELQGSTVWTVRVVTEHRDGSRREVRYRLNIG
jgi:TonB-dependent SusC/RagA subfamily outer membrane receptor